MNPEIKERWVAALRSGDYKQSAGHLHRNNSFCCLGVLCDLAARDGIVRAEGESYVAVNNEDDDACSFLPVVVQEWAGLDSCNPSVKERQLATYNDSLAYDFKRIADLIEGSL